jgi:hypothetical protein
MPATSDQVCHPDLAPKRGSQGHPLGYGLMRPDCRTGMPTAGGRRQRNMKATHKLVILSIALALTDEGRGQAPSFLTNGLVAYYPLNGNANDASGNGNNAAASNTANDTDRFGKSNSSFYFNGSTSELSIAKPLLDFGRDYTVSLWFKFKDPRLQNQPLVFSANRTPALGIMYNDAPTAPNVINWSVGIGTAGGWTASDVHGDKTNYAAGQWYQLVFRKNGSAYSLFLNGVLESAAGIAMDFQFNVGLDFGFLSGSPSYLNGSLDDIRIYSRALADGEVEELYAYEANLGPNVEGLVAYYPFTGNASDATGNGNDGVIHNATVGRDRFGLGESLYFNGTNAYVSVDNTPPIQSLPLLTVSAWVKYVGITPGPYGDNIISKVSDDSTALAWNLSIVPSGKLRPHANVGTWSYFDCQTTLQTGFWYQVAMVFDGAQLAGFVNGQPDGSISLKGTIASSTQPMRIGVYSPTLPSNQSMFFWGQIDEVRLYNRALSGFEIQQLYEAEMGPRVALIKAVKPSFSNLLLGASYQLQVSDDLNTWTSQGVPFSATNSTMVYPQYWDVDNWDQLSFRLQAAP